MYRSLLHYPVQNWIFKTPSYFLFIFRIRYNMHVMLLFYLSIFLNFHKNSIMLDILLYALIFYLTIPCSNLFCSTHRDLPHCFYFFILLFFLKSLRIYLIVFNIWAILYKNDFLQFIQPSLYWWTFGVFFLVVCLL